MCAKNKPYKANGKRVKIGPYEVDLLIDEDGHLNLWVESKDGSAVEDIELGIEDGIFSSRFTTEKIEREYKESV